MAKTEYQVRVEIQESRDGNPLKKGKRFYKTIWIQASDSDEPYDVMAAAKNTMINQDWIPRS